MKYENPMKSEAKGRTPKMESDEGYGNSLLKMVPRHFLRGYPVNSLFENRLFGGGILDSDRDVRTP